MGFDYNTFATQLGMSAEDKAALDGLFGKYPKAGEQIDSFISTEVTSRLTPLQADLASKQRDLDQQFDTLTQLRGADSATLDEAQKKYEEAASKVTLATERIRRVAKEAGLNPDDYLTGLTEAVVKPPEPKNPVVADLEERFKLLARQDWSVLNNGAELEDIASEHQALFGKPLPGNDKQGGRQVLLAKLQEKVKRTGDTSLTLRDVWNEEYGVSARRTELAQADVTRQVNEAYERGKREAADAAALGSQIVNDPKTFGESPIRTLIPKDSPVRVNGVPEAVTAAISTYRKERDAQNRVA